MSTALAIAFLLTTVFVLVVAVELVAMALERARAEWDARPFFIHDADGLIVRVNVNYQKTPRRHCLLCGKKVKEGEGVGDYRGVVHQQCAASVWDKAARRGDVPRSLGRDQ